MYVLIAGHSNTYVYLLLSNIIIIGPLILISPPATQISGPGLSSRIGINENLCKLKEARQTRQTEVRLPARTGTRIKPPVRLGRAPLPTKTKHIKHDFVISDSKCV